MSDIINVINNLPDLLSLKPIDEAMISEEERKLNLRFAKEYKMYLMRFGAIIADGIELTGITNSSRSNVIDKTINEWKINPSVPRNMYVIEDLGIDGIVIWQSTNGEIYQTTPNGTPKKIAKSLAEYLTQK